MLYHTITELLLQHFSCANFNESFCSKQRPLCLILADGYTLLLLPYSPDGAPSQYHYTLRCQSLHIDDA